MKEKLARFMIGRNGNDQLNLFLLAVDLVLLIAASLVKGAGGKLLYLLVFALLGYAYFRMFSRNSEKRMAENRKYIELTSGWKTKIRQFSKRMKNRRDYRYFKCPNCKVLLRMKRGSGEKDITCVRCGFQFKQKS